MSIRRCLYIGSVFPESDSSAAGVRVVQLLKIMAQAGWTTACTSIGKPRSQKHVQEIVDIGTPYGNPIITDITPLVLRTSDKWWRDQYCWAYLSWHELAALSYQWGGDGLRAQTIQARCCYVWKIHARRDVRPPRPENHTSSAQSYRYVQTSSMVYNVATLLFLYKHGYDCINAYSSKIHRI